MRIVLQTERMIIMSEETKTAPVQEEKTSMADYEQEMEASFKKI